MTRKTELPEHLLGEDAGEDFEPLDDVELDQTELDGTELDGTELDDEELDAEAFDAEGSDDETELELVVLDLAGTTVVDDGVVEGAFAAAWNAVRGTEHHDAREAALEYVRATMGQSKLDVFRHFAVDEAEAQAFVREFESAYAATVAAGGCVAIPGAEAVIRAFIGLDVPVAFTTGFSRSTVDAILAALGWDELDVVSITPAEAGRGRPWPDLPLTALLRSGASSVAGMVVVGDTPSDMRSGVAAGAGLVVGVLTGAGSEEELFEAGADEVIESVAELPGLLGIELEG